MLPFSHLRDDERGAAVIELAMVAPMLALMTIGVVDLSNAYSRKLALEQGAQRAIEKVMQTTELDTVENTLTTEAVCQVNGMNANGTCKTSPISAANVTVTYRLECNNSGAIVSSQSSTDSDCVRPARLQRHRKAAKVHRGQGHRQLPADVRTSLPGIQTRVGNLAAGYQMQATAGVRTE